jgi:hypothetical protein
MGLASMALRTIIAQHSHVYVRALDAIDYARLRLSSPLYSYLRLAEHAQRKPRKSL